jgi:hypothetical protein
MKIDRTNHLSHATEVPTTIHLINKVTDLIIWTLSTKQHFEKMEV